MDEDRRGSDDGDDVVAHDVKRRHRIVVDVIDVEVHLARHGIKRTPLPGAPTVDRISSAVHRGVSHDGRFVVEVSEIRSEMVIQAPRHKI